MFDLKHLPNPVHGEEIVHFLRRHPINLLSVLLGYVLLFFTPTFGFLYVWTYAPSVLSDPVIMLIVVLIGSLFFLFGWLILFQMFMDYYLDVWIVTTRRILSIEQTGLFSRVVSELRLYRVQDVTATVNGLFHTLLNYGELEIQTAGEKTHFVFEEIPHPMNISKSILELAEEDRRKHLDEAMEESGAMKDPD